MDELFKIAKHEGIIVETFPLQPPLYGVYLCQPGSKPVIGLSNVIATDRERRCIMAEELGHHFTTVGQCIPREFYHRNMRSNINRAEHKAMRWAAKHLIPKCRLIQAIESGITTIWDLTEYFNVVEDILLFRLKLPDLQNFRQTYIAKHGTDWTGRVLFKGFARTYVLFELLDTSFDLLV
ncbi:MAG: hypothetical protein H6Q69_296 [Firmicutes bacterium]|nr:hypothetical protein [Bacillota bacterium]